MTSTSSNGQDGKIPEPIPRSSQATQQTEDSREQADSTRETPKRQASEGKKESRGFEYGSNGKEWSGGPRGGKRGGRGRGGSREYTNSHQANQAFANGHAEFASPFGVPPSPSAFQSPRGTYGYGPQPGRGGWRGNPRSQSIPIDNMYGSRYATYGAPSQLPPVQTYYPGMYDYSSMPMSAMPYPPIVEHQYLVEMVGTQLDYYFSLDNLLKDMFLRRNMDSQGFVFLDVIGNFNRIKQLTNDRELLKFVCLHSDTIDIKVGDDGKERLRRYDGWEQFVLPKEQRESSAQNDGPQNSVRPQEPRMHVWAPPPSIRGPHSAGLPGQPQRRSYDAGYVMNGAVPQFAPFSPPVDSSYGDVPNGDEMRGRAAKSPIRETSVPPGQSLFAAADYPDVEPDVFPDEQTSTLTVVVKMQPPKPQHAAARTFSNGSIDTRSVFGELDQSNEDNAKPAANGEPSANGEPGHSSVPHHASPTLGRSPEKPVSNELTLLWVKDKEVPQESLPQDATLEPYLQLKVKALNQRAEAATGTCPYDLDVLYQFWSHFLIRNFNNQMYREFKLYANSDAQQRHTGTGLQNLVQFYAKALASSNPIRDHIVKDYVDLVKNEPAILQGMAFKQLRQAWRNGALNLKNRKRLTDIVDDQLRARLES